MLKKIILTLMFLLFSACGGGGTSVEPTPLKTLYFIDSPVNGIDYSCGKRNGITKKAKVKGEIKDGVLYCSKGDIIFSLGSLVLGTITEYKDGQEIRPQDLVGVPQDYFEDENVIKTALLLQSLDDDAEINENITITEETKKRLTIKSLNDLSIAEVNNLITSVGKTPVPINNVKKHLIRNSSISYEDAKPSIAPFSEDIATASSSGFTIGNLDINQGDSPLTSLTLSGEGSEKFQLNINGKLTLLSKIDTAKNYTFEVIAENIYGVTKQKININIIKGDILAKVELAIISEATVKIIKLTEKFPAYNEELIYTETTSKNGNFNTHANELEEDTFYVFEVTGGTLLDSDNDGIKDFTQKPYTGVMRLIAKGSWIKNSNKKIRITPLSEMLYDYIVESIKEVMSDRYGTPSLEENIEKCSKILLNQDLNGDNTIDGKDIFGFNPLSDKQYLYRTLTNKKTYDIITKKLISNDIIYLKYLFNAYILEEFTPAENIKIDGSFAYIYGEDSFYIYDLINHKKLGSISLPKTNNENIERLISLDSSFNNNKYKHVSIYLQKNKNRIFLTNLNAEVIAINIQDFNNPKILMKKEIGVGKHIIDIHDNILFFTDSKIPLNTTIVSNSEIKMLDIQDIKHSKVITIPNFPYLNHIKYTQDNTIGISIFTQNDKIILNQYNLNNLRKNPTLKMFSSQSVNYLTFDINQFYFDNQDNLYSMSMSLLTFYEYSLESFSETSSLGLYRAGGYIYNRNKDFLYISGIEYRYNLLNLINLKFSIVGDPNPYVYNSRTFDIDENQESIYFYDNIFTTNHRIIDTNSYLFSPHSNNLLFGEEASNNEWYREMFQRFTPN